MSLRGPRMGRGPLARVVSGPPARSLALAAAILLIAACKKEPGPAPPALPATAASQQTETTPSHDVPSNPIRRFADTHTHLSPYAYPLFIRLADEIGIYRAVNMSGGSDAELRRENLALADKFPGRIALFFNPDWSRIDDPNFAKDEAQALRDAVKIGFAGLKISKALGLGVQTKDEKLVPVDDPRLDPLWAAAGELGVPVAIHTSDPKAFFEKPGPENERHAELSLAPGWSFYGEQYPSREELLAQRDRMIAKHPDTTFILLHFGNNPEDVDYVDQLLTKHPNLYVDVAARIGEIGRHDAAKVRDIFVRHQDRILFATDIMVGVFPTKDGRARYKVTLGSISEKPPTLDDVLPFYTQHWRYFEESGEPIAHPVPIQGDWKVNPLGLEQAVLEKVYYRNAERLIFAPWLARRTAHHVVGIAQQ